MKVTVNVTQAHINTAKETRAARNYALHDTEYPYALALQDAITSNQAATPYMHGRGIIGVQFSKGKRYPSRDFQAIVPSEYRRSLNEQLANGPVSFELDFREINETGMTPSSDTHFPK